MYAKRFILNWCTSGKQKEAKRDTVTEEVTEQACYHRSHVFQFEGQVTERLEQGNLTAPPAMLTSSTPNTSANHLLLQHLKQKENDLRLTKYANIYVFFI